MFGETSRLFYKYRLMYYSLNKTKIMFLWVKSESVYVFNKLGREKCIKFIKINIIKLSWLEKFIQIVKI